MWTCNRCTLINEDRRNKCEVCDNEKFQDSATFGGEQDYVAFGGEQGYYDAELRKDWKCTQCMHRNYKGHVICANCFCPRTDETWREDHSDILNSEFEVRNEIRIVLIGRTGSGKSATGNTILGIKKFESLVSGSSVTSKCKRGETDRERKKIVVVDTPGLFDTGMTNEKVTKEIVKCIGMTSPGPHAMVLVVGIGRFTKEEQDTVQHFVDHFGEGMLKYMIVLFTRQDDLLKANQTVHQYVTTVPTELQQILRQCGNRYIAFNNDATGSNREVQVGEFFKMVDRMLTNNGGSCYTSEIYREAEATLQRRMKQQKQKLEMEKRREKDQIELQIQEKYERILQKETTEKSRLEHELTTKQSAEKEAKKRETSYKSEIHSLRQQVSERGDTRDKARMEREIENLEQQLKSVEIGNYERERIRLQRDLDESNRRLERQMEERERDKTDLVKRMQEDYDRKMKDENLRKHERDNVENEESGAINEIVVGVKKVCSGVVKAGKKIWNFFFG